MNDYTEVQHGLQHLSGVYNELKQGRRFKAALENISPKFCEILRTHLILGGQYLQNIPISPACPNMMIRKKEQIIWADFLCGVPMEKQRVLHWYYQKGC